MEKQEFIRKLARSLFLITALAALSLALSGRSRGTCSTIGDCTKCQKQEQCTLPTKK